jgi:DNA-binding LytR/AlgR family response regulator
MLQNEGFIQTDRGTIVNARKIDSYHPSMRVVTIPWMDGKVSIPFSEKVQRKLEEELSAVFSDAR